MSTPNVTDLRFEYVPVFGGVAGTSMRVIDVYGLSTKHGATNNDRGRLYASIALSGGTYTITLYADLYQLTAVASGTTTTLGTPVQLSPVGNSNLWARVILDTYIADTANIVLVPTFAVDEDVIVDMTACASLPGYTSQYGLGKIHARAMRRLVTSALPAALPFLYGSSGLTAFTPETLAGGGSLPDLTKIANTDQLRGAQADLVKWFCAKEQEHVAEYAALAKVAAGNFKADMEEITASNMKEPEAAAVERADNLGFSTGTWSRG